MQSNAALYSETSWPNESLVVVYVGLGIFAAALLVRIWKAQPATTAGFIRQHPVVLLPTVLVMNLLSLLGRVPWLTAVTPTYHPVGLTVRVSLLFFVSIVCAPLAVWATVWLTHSFADVQSPAPTIQQAWRFVAASLLATIAMLLLVVAMMAIGTLGTAALLLMGLIWLGFNLLSCTWYAAMLNGEPKLWASLRDAALFGVRRWRPLSIRVALQLLFTGFFVWYSVTTDRSDPPPLPRPPVLPTAGQGGSSSSFGGVFFGSHISDGWAIQLIWVLSADDTNQWLQKTAAEADETPWPISRYIVDSLTVLVGTYFIVGYSLVLLRRPITAKADRRRGFEVLAVRPGFPGLPPTSSALDVIDRPAD